MYLHTRAKRTQEQAGRFSTEPACIAACTIIKEEIFLATALFVHR
jgi:hypothetical protein